MVLSVQSYLTGKVLFLFFRSFLLVLARLSFLRGGGGVDWGLGYHSVEFGQFPDIS